MKEQILNGELPYPGSKIFEDYPEQEKLIKNFWNTIWFNYLNDNETNGIHWYEKLGIKLYNDVVKRASNNKWLYSYSLTGRKWLSVKLNELKLLEFVSPDELQKVKEDFKYKKYTLSFNEANRTSLTKLNGKIQYTGLVREGFAMAGNTQFGYDMKMLDKYENAVKLNLTKSMDKIRKFYPEMKTTGDSYDAVSIGIYGYHRNNLGEIYTTGENINDSRGRAISNCLSKVANPIGNKDFRASLIITY